MFSFVSLSLLSVKQNMTNVYENELSSNAPY